MAIVRFLSLLVLAGVATAAPSALKAYRAELRRIDRDERAFWKAFGNRQAKARVVFMAPYNEMLRAMNDRPGKVKDLIVDPSAYRELYVEYVALARKRGAAAVALASSGHPRTLKILFTELLDLAKDIERTEKEVWDRTGYGGWSFFDQRPAVRRHGLAAYRDSIVAALSKTPDAASYLATEGMKQARKRDGARSIERCVAVLDVLGRTGDPAALPVLEQSLLARATWERIAALEALISSAAPAKLVSLLDDPSPVVRRALLDAARTRGDPRWIPHVLRTYPAASDALRHEHLATLRALSGQAFGDEPDRWKAWHERHRDAIASGAFDPAKAAKEETATKDPGKRRPVFHGVPLRSERVIFALDGSSNLLLPADWDFQKTRAYHDWTSGRRDWKGKHETHQDVLAREFRETLEALPDSGAFGALMVKESGALKTIGEKRLLRPTRANVRQAVHFVESHAPRGFRPELANLVTAMEMAGMRPFDVPDLPQIRADTAVLMGSGSVQGGRFVVPEAALAAFERLNRFRRLTVHTVRICNAGPPSERYFKRLAEMTGGTYRWSRKSCRSLPAR